MLRSGFFLHLCYHSSSFHSLQTTSCSITTKISMELLAPCCLHPDEPAQDWVSLHYGLNVCCHQLIMGEALVQRVKNPQSLLSTFETNKDRHSDLRHLSIWHHYNIALQAQQSRLFDLWMARCKSATPAIKLYPFQGSSKDVKGRRLMGFPWKIKMVFDSTSN